MMKSLVTSMHRSVRDPEMLMQLMREESQGFLKLDEYCCKANGELGVFHCAVLSGCKESVLLLFERGADINEQDASGKTPLIRACNEGMEDMVEFLVELGADVNIRDHDGQNCAHAAYSLEHLELGDWLRANTRVDMTRLDNEGRSPYDWRRMCDDMEQEEQKYDPEPATNNSFTCTSARERYASSSNAFVINGKENNFAAGSGIRATRWLRKGDNGVICCDRD